MSVHASLVYTHIYTHVYTHVYPYVYANVYTHVCTHVHTHGHAYSRTHVYTLAAGQEEEEAKTVSDWEAIDGQVPFVVIAYVGMACIL